MKTKIVAPDYKGFRFPLFSVNVSKFTLHMLRIPWNVASDDSIVIVGKMNLSTYYADSGNFSMIMKNVLFKNVKKTIKNYDEEKHVKTLYTPDYVHVPGNASAGGLRG